MRNLIRHKEFYLISNEKDKEIYKPIGLEKSCQKTMALGRFAPTNALSSISMWRIMDVQIKLEDDTCLANLINCPNPS